MPWNVTQQASCLMPPASQAGTLLQAELWMDSYCLAFQAKGYKNTLVECRRQGGFWNQSCFFQSVFSYCCCFQDASLIKIKIWSQNRGPGETFTPLRLRRCILLLPAFLLCQENKIQSSKAEDLIGCIQWFVNRAAFHLATRRALGRVIQKGRFLQEEGCVW